MIQTFQIQTNNLCNSKCIMCPHYDLQEPYNKMDTNLFEKIILDIKQAIENKLVIEKPSILPFYQNDPLLDDRLFDFIEITRTILPSCNISFYTNGILFNKYYDKLIKTKVNNIVFSIYGWDAKSFNYLTRLKFTQQQFNDMLLVAQRLKKNAPYELIFDYAWDKNHQFRDFSTRAGFFSNNKIIHTKVNGCSWNRDKWINILADGKIPLCCMDWRKEYILGDVSKQTISQIIQSNKRISIINKISGDESEPLFLCKRCEKAKGNGDNILMNINEPYFNSP